MSHININFYEENKRRRNEKMGDKNGPRPLFYLNLALLHLLTCKVGDQARSLCRVPAQALLGQGA
jgi:hypothetical protein